MAADQGRDVFAVPGSPLDPRCRGTNDLIRQGAVLTENVSDILHHVRFTKPQPDFQLSEAESRGFTAAGNTIPEDNVAKARPHIIEKLGITPVSVDEIITQLGISPQIVLTVILELELAGKLERHSGNRVSLLYSRQTEELFSFA
jgi:DNA processing protein